jgi:hypothetical protein
VLVDKDIHEEAAEVGSRPEELKETAIVALDEGTSNLKGVDYGLRGLIFRVQVLEQAEDLSLHITKEVVENLISQEFLHKEHIKYTEKNEYDRVALEALFVKVVKLGLALIEMV